MRQLLTVKELAEVLKIKEQTVYQYACKGVIPYVKVGSCLRFDGEEINNWIKEHSYEGDIR